MIRPLKEVLSIKKKMMELVYQMMMKTIDFLSQNGMDSVVIILYDANREKARVYRKKINGQMPLPAAKHPNDVIREIVATGCLRKGDPESLDYSESIETPEFHKKQIEQRCEVNVEYA